MGIAHLIWVCPGHAASYRSLVVLDLTVPSLLWGSSPHCNSQPSNSYHLRLKSDNTSFKTIKIKEVFSERWVNLHDSIKFLCDNTVKIKKEKISGVSSRDWPQGGLCGTLAESPVAVTCSKLGDSGEKESWMGQLGEWQESHSSWELSKFTDERKEGLKRENWCVSS